MLIRRDRLVAGLYRLSPDFETSLVAKSMPITENVPMSVLKERAASQERIVQHRISNLVRDVMGLSGQVDEAAARAWLQI